jgi:signal transduction histidine kinase
VNRFRTVGDKLTLALGALAGAYDGIVPRRFRTVGLKLTLALIGLVLGALAIVYLAIVPTLKDRLIEDRLDQLERTATFVVRDINSNEDQFGLDAILQTESQQRGVRVIVWRFLTENPPVFLQAEGDSRGLGRAPESDPVAQRAAERQGGIARGVVERNGTRFAEVAVRFGGLRVALIASPIEDTFANVALVQRRLVVAGLIALAAAALVGFALARVFARRIRRLERAAGRIAAGRFDEPVDRGADELGELALAFDDMRKRLAALERARREFIANASHELRTPIFALGGHLELLTDDEVDERDRREFLEEMRRQVERLTKLATDLLDLSRIDAGQLHVELGPVDLSEIAGSLVGEFMGVGRGSEHALVSDADDGTFARADEERVRQIGRILLENALVHTPPGTHVRLETGTEDEVAELRVEDDGPGISAGDREHVFDRFYRADTALAAGSGLGLAIARELATMMGGALELESRPGRTVFTLRLPREAVPTHEREPALAG